MSSNSIRIVNDVFDSRFSEVRPTLTPRERSSGRLFRFCALFLFLCLLLHQTGMAQNRERLDHIGREFRMAYLHTDGDDDFPKYYLEVSSQVQTRGTITYESTGKVVSISIPTPNRAYRILLDTSALLMPDPVRDSAISRQTIHVKFDDEVSIYGINTLRWSSDGFLALPNDVLGKEYVVMSYPNTAEVGPAGQIFESSDFPSQFAVIATEDNTTITVNPSVPINASGSTAAYTEVLQKGQVYFGQAIDRKTLNGFVQRAGQDVTGTTIRSNKPIVVYGSHQRTNIPYSDAVGRDHLVEQLAPVDHWGTRAMITPHFQLDKTVKDANIVRVVAAQPNTILTIDSANSMTIPAGRPLQFELKGPMLLTANGKIEVAQFQHSTVEVQFMAKPNDSIGDPFMMLIPSREQFDTSYTFESWDTKDFVYHFINIVIPNERISTLLLDNRPVTQTFTRIPKTSYSYAQIKLDPGSHHIEARVPFGLYVYGYGPYNSYGFPGGMVFDSIFKDHIEPEIHVRDTCGGIVGNGLDTARLAYGMEDVRLLDGSRNVELFKDPFMPGDDSIHFRVMLIDPYQDGLAQMIAIDTAGLERRYEFRVKGFTVAVTEGPPIVQLDTLASLNGLEFCKSITLRNYGQFPQTINQLAPDKVVPGFTIPPIFPLTLQPGETRTIRLCFQYTGDFSTDVLLSVVNDCFTRTVARLPLISGIDSIPPQITRISSDCDFDITFDIQEAGAMNSGIKEVNVHAKQNADIILPSANQLPGKQATIEIHRKSIWEDVVYDIEVIDVVGNRVRLADTIGGLTLQISNISGDEEFGFRFDPQHPWTYDPITYTEQNCDTLVFSNVGLRDLDLHRLHFSGNYEYSVPPNQLPIHLKPGESRSIEVCVKPIGNGYVKDTLVIEFFCGQLVNVVSFDSFARLLTGNGTDRCGNQMALNIGGFTQQDFIQDPSPNPVKKGSATLTFGLAGKRNVTMTLHDGMGNEIQRLLDNDPLPGGISQISADLHSYATGTYYVRMITETDQGDVKEMVQRLVITQ